MDFALATGPAHAVACDLLAVPTWQDDRAGLFAELDRSLGNLLGKVADEERYQGKPGQSLLLHSHGKVGAARVLVIGMGPKEEGDAASLRHAAARASRTGRSVGAKHVALALPPLPAAVDEEHGLQLVAEGLLLGRYRFDRYVSEAERRPDLLETITLVAPGANAAFAKATQRAQVVAASVGRARDLVNEPAADLTPTRMAEVAKKLADEHGLEIKVLGPAECRALGMGMYLGVAQGSDEEPRFIHIAYRPKGGAQKRVCLVGKGITFDSGGLSLKPTAAMEDMKVDMAGAAAVLSTMAAIAQLGAPVEVHAIAACTENMPSGKASKLGDVLRSMSGKTVEINNTDAEGRLTLGDALTYALRLSPDEVFDFATLTGACVIALGPHIAGVMSNNSALAERWLASARAAGEEMWPLPLPERLKEQLKSDIADLKNTGERWGGALTAGLFLRDFVDKIPWVHVDIAGPASAEKEYGAIPKGGTGFAVATLVEYLASR